MIVVGIDSSLTGTGIAWLDTDTGECMTSRVKTDSVKKGDPLRIERQAIRMEHIADEVLRVALGNNGTGLLADCVVIEGLSFGSRGNATRDLAGLWWRIVTDLVSRDFELVVVTPQTRAKYATGSTRAGKSDVLSAVRSAFPDVDVPNHDVADSVALAALGARVNGHAVEVVPLPWQVEVAASVAAREAEKGTK